MPNQVGSPLTYFQKWAFVVEIDGVKVGGFQDAGPLKQTMAVVEQHEGGARTVVDISTSVYKTEKIKLTRGGSDNDELWQWWAILKSGAQDKRNVSVVAQDGQGNPLQRWNYSLCVITEFDAGSFDRKNETENIMETVELQGVDMDRKPGV